MLGFCMKSFWFILWLTTCILGSTEWTSYLPVLTFRRGFKHLPSYFNFFIIHPFLPQALPEVLICDGVTGDGWNCLCVWHGAAPAVPTTTSIWGTAPQSCNPTFPKFVICQYFDIRSHVLQDLLQQIFFHCKYVCIHMYNSTQELSWYLFSYPEPSFVAMTMSRITKMWKKFPALLDLPRRNTFNSSLSPTLPFSLSEENSVIWEISNPSF